MSLATTYTGIFACSALMRRISENAVFDTTGEPPGLLAWMMMARTFLLR